MVMVTGARMRTPVRKLLRRRAAKDIFTGISVIYRSELSVVAIETRMKTDNAGWSSTMQAKNCEIFVRNPFRIHPFDMAKTEAAIIVRITCHDAP